MAFHKKYQVYNKQNKQFVLMENGEILGNDYLPFEGVPHFGSRPADPEQKQALKDIEQGKQITREKNDNAAGGVKDSNKSGGSDGTKEDLEEPEDGFFSWF